MKSIYQRLGEATEKLTDVGKINLYNERAAKLVSTEAKVHCAEKLLKEIGESTTPIKKHNGAADNATELELTESFNGGEVVADPREAQVNGYMLSCNISEAEARKVLGLSPKGLTVSQATEFMLATACGISESDALVLCKK